MKSVTKKKITKKKNKKKQLDLIDVKVLEEHLKPKPEVDVNCYIDFLIDELFNQLLSITEHDWNRYEEEEDIPSILIRPGDYDELNKIVLLFAFVTALGF